MDTLCPKIAEILETTIGGTITKKNRSILMQRRGMNVKIVKYHGKPECNSAETASPKSATTVSTSCIFN
jgi:hypothetical protein